MSDSLFELVLEVAKETGRLEKHNVEMLAEVAKKLLLRGRPIEEIAEDTGLPYETVLNLV